MPYSVVNMRTLWGLHLVSIFLSSHLPCRCGILFFSLQCFYRLGCGILVKVKGFIRGYVKNHWTNTRLVCTHMNALFVINQNMTPGGPLVFQGGYHPRKTTFKKHPKHVFFQVWKCTLNTYFLAFSLPKTSNSSED